MQEENNKSEMSQMLESMQRQENWVKRGLWHQRIRTAMVLVVVIVALSMMGTISATMHDVQLLTGNASYAVGELLDTVEALDLQNTMGGINRLVQGSTQMIESSSEDIQRSLQAIAGLDVEGLNESIQALEAITTNIGRLFGYKPQS